MELFRKGYHPELLKKEGMFFVMLVEDGKTVAYINGNSAYSNKGEIIGASMFGACRNEATANEYFETLTFAYSKGPVTRIA